MTECKRCGRKKTWSGDDIKCPFQTSEEFGDNWNCGIISSIRQLCELSKGDKDRRLGYQYCEDQHYTTINIDDVDLPTKAGAVPICLWVTWYKSRGSTEGMWVLYDGGKEPQKPTYKELEAIIKYYKTQQ